jgi:hypothetical protein
MKQETIKELGKFIMDLSKIVIAIAVITPFVNGGSINLTPIFLAVITTSLGLFLINKGVKDV